MRFLTSTAARAGRSAMIVRLVVPKAMIIAAIVGHPVLAQSANTLDHSPGVPPDSASVSAPSGLQLYRQQYCGLCHSLRKAETQGIFGPDHDDMEATARARLSDPDYKGHASTPADYVRESILKPEIYIVPGFEATVHRMPAYTHLAPEVVEALVVYLLEPECVGGSCPKSESETAAPD